MVQESIVIHWSFKKVIEMVFGAGNIDNGPEITEKLKALLRFEFW